MDGQAITTKCDLERMLLDGGMEAKPLSLSLLKCITNDFSRERHIGHGGFAVVYKGQLEYAEVAVKKLNQDCINVDEEKFIGEVQCLMKAKHKNIVRFLGYCSDTQGQMMEYNGMSVMIDVRQRLLCFEYIPNGSLDKYIKDSSREWGKCYKIIKGVCEGLNYLHKERIVHRDLKPANILLDNGMVPKIADFGVSKCFGELQTHDVTSKRIGSIGYLAPEFICNGKITLKSDIYSLGTTISEILTGHKGCPEVEEVKKHWSHRLEGSQKELQLEQILVCTEVAQMCLEFNPEDRPTAQEILDTLKQTECTEPGGSSDDACSSAAAASASTPLTRTAAPTNMLKKQQPQPLYQNHSRAARAQPWKRKRTLLDPETVARKIEMLMQAISRFYARDTKDMIFEDLYSGVYYLVLEKKGEELYSAVETTMASEVQSLCRPLDDAAPADSALFLQEMLTKWNLHIGALRLIDCVFPYMDRTFVRTNGKMPTSELGLCLWRDEMARSDKIQPMLIEAVKRQKGGEDELVPGVNKMLTELGADVKDNDNVPFLCFRDDGTGVQPFLHGWTPDAKTMPKTMKILMQAISKIYAGDVKDLPFEDLYRVVYDLVQHSKKGEELYSVTETTIASEVQRLCRPLEDAAAPVDSALFLKELLTKWNRHIWALVLIRDLFMYMERTFVICKGKTPIYRLGLRLWREEMAHSDNIRPRLIEAVRRQEGGEGELVPGVNKMLMELGADVMDKDNIPFLCFQDGIGVQDFPMYIV